MAPKKNDSSAVDGDLKWMGKNVGQRLGVLACSYIAAMAFLPVIACIAIRFFMGPEGVLVQWR